MATDGEVIIEYGAIEIEGRWYPSLWLRGKDDPSCTVCVGYSRNEAIALAKPYQDCTFRRFAAVFDFRC